MKTINGIWKIALGLYVGFVLTPFALMCWLTAFESTLTLAHYMGGIMFGSLLTYSIITLYRGVKIVRRKDTID